MRFGRFLRITRPSLSAAVREDGATFTGLAEATSGPAFATTAGLLAVAMQPDLAAARGGMDYSGGGLFSRFGQWMRQNL